MDFILGFRQSTFLCTTLKCIEKFRIPFIKSGIPASNLGSSEARNPAKFAACYYIFASRFVQTNSCDMIDLWQDAPLEISVAKFDI